MARNIFLALYRGLKANLPTLNAGEMAFTTDTSQFWLGSSSGNKLIGPMPCYSASGALLGPSVHIVTGFVTIPSGGSATITLSGLAVFSTATSYSVFVTDNIAKRTLNVVQNSGTSFTISGGGTGDVVQYFCIGT